MSKRERKARHLAAAAYLRSVTDEDEIVEVGLPSPRRVRRRAGRRRGGRDPARRARDAAESERASGLLGANEEAQRYAERAIELADDARGSAELHERAGMMAVAHLDIEPGVEHFRRAIELFESEDAMLRRPACRRASATRCGRRARAPMRSS